MKDFANWMQKKAELDTATHNPPHVSVGDIWWASIGENIGSEVNGKSELYSRPVIIFKKLAHGFYFVIPTSTKDKKGSWYVPYRHQEVHNVACLHQARAVDHRRILSKLGTLDDTDFASVKDGFMKLYC